MKFIKETNPTTTTIRVWTGNPEKPYEEIEVDTKAFNELEYIPEPNKRDKGTKNDLN
jgi:hypothetical protein|tara:strand:+ start:306 stop:476 length:171 start_codon:yes stop_codon:yes gene_type:complete